jgi:hypothetical protein
LKEIKKSVGACIVSECSVYEAMGIKDEVNKMEMETEMKI